LPKTSGLDESVRNYFPRVVLATFFDSLDPEINADDVCHHQRADSHPKVHRGAIDLQTRCVWARDKQKETRSK
jgi:hypothetical protein